MVFNVLRISLFIVCLVFLIGIGRQVAKGKMLLKYSLLWIALAFILALFCLFPEPLFALSDVLGFETPSNALFAAAVFFLLAVCVSLTIIVSGQSNKIKTLIQYQTLLEDRLMVLEKRISSTSSEEQEIQ